MIPSLIILHACSWQKKCTTPIGTEAFGLSLIHSDPQSPRLTRRTFALQMSIF